MAAVRVLELCSLKGALAQLVARFHGMEEVRGSNPLCSTARTRLEPLPTETLVEVRALFASAAQVRAFALTCGSRSISKGRLCSTRSSLSSSMKTLVKNAWLHSRLHRC